MLIEDWNKLKKILDELKSRGNKVVFTNGCFDILHSGHVDYLNKAKALGDVLVVAINSDESVSRIKGAKRPVLNQKERAFVVDNLKAVDYVTFFDQDTPAEIIDFLIPDVLVKGADWKIDEIVGAKTVIGNGGSVERIDFVSQQSTTKIIEKIVSKYCN